jgi:hypothetical protein
MNSQLAFQHTKEYKSLSTMGVCIGQLCGKPVYRKFDMRDVRPDQASLIKDFVKGLEV